MGNIPSFTCVMDELLQFELTELWSRQMLSK